MISGHFGSYGLLQFPTENEISGDSAKPNGGHRRSIACSACFFAGSDAFTTKCTSGTSTRRCGRAKRRSWYESTGQRIHPRKVISTDRKFNFATNRRKQKVMPLKHRRADVVDEMDRCGIFSHMLDTKQIVQHGGRFF